MPTIAPAVDLDGPWRLSSQVALRPEAFGGLAYHFGTRRLSFLKSRTLLDIVSSLGEYPSAREACRAAGVAGDEQYERALCTLAETGMITPGVRR